MGEEEEEKNEGDHKNPSNTLRTSTTIDSNILVDITIPIGLLPGGSNREIFEAMAIRVKNKK